jgi:hypothetical protein
MQDVAYRKSEKFIVNFGLKLLGRIYLGDKSLGKDNIKVVCQKLCMNYISPTQDEDQ